MIRKRLLGAAAVVALGLTTVMVGTAEASVDPKNPCNLQGWFVNDDESARAPERKLAGFEFDGSDLIHHSTDVRLGWLKPGWYKSDTAPDQPSFFSVEVRDQTTDAYGTLRWNKSTAMWDLVAKGELISKADPKDFIGVETKWGKFTEATRVVTFGVGYTANPPGAKKVVVSLIHFMGKDYNLTCEKEVDPSATPTKSPTTSPTASPTSSPTKSPSGSPTATPTKSPTGSPTATPSATGTGTPSPMYENCAAVYKAGKAPLKKGQPGYRAELDSDGDGIACEINTQSPYATPRPASEEEELPVTGAGTTAIILGGLALLCVGTVAVISTRRKRRAS